MVRHARYSPLIYLLAISSTLVRAQEDCVRACTSNSGINQCVGSIPHNDTDWNALTTSVQNCYCNAALDFAVCSPTCNTDGFASDLLGRLFGVWRYVNDDACKSVLDEFKATASISTNTARPTSSRSSTSVAPTTTSPPRVGVNANTPPPANPETTFTTSVTPTSVSSMLLSLVTDTALPLVSETPSESSSPSSSSSSSRVRIIAISVTLGNFAALSIGAALWLLFRRRRQSQLTQNIYVRGDTKNSVIVMGADGLQVDQSAPGFASALKGGLRNETVTKWIQDQEREKDSDTETDTLSVGYTLWTETDLCPTEIGAEDSRGMEAIKEEPDGEDEIRRMV